MRSLLTMPLSEITFDDVESFCHPPDGPPENQVLEYKSGRGGEKVPSREIAKAASALANTFGGMIILGVEDDHKGGRPKDIPGVPADRDLDKEVSSILFDDITPPLVPLPEIGAVELPDNREKAVVVIRVAQSNATPHAIKNSNGNPCIYVRAGSESRPTEDWETPAGPEKLAWLFNRRRKSEELHDRIRDEALDRTKLYYDRGIFPHFSGNRRPHGQGVFWILPLYPEGPVTTVQRLHDGCVGHETTDAQRLQIIEPNCSDFPSYSWMTPASIQDGVVGLTEVRDTQVRSFEFNIYGMFLYQETFAYKLPAPLDETWSLDFTTLCQQLASFLQLASRFYDVVDPVGLLELHVTVMNLDGLCMLPPVASNSPVIDQVGHVVSYQRYVDCKRTVQANLLRDSDQRDETFLGLLCEIGNAFNWKESLVRQVVGHIPR